MCVFACVMTFLASTRLDSAQTGGLETANLKRESKAYSYEDQKWEMELRKEMMRKRKEQVSGAGKDVRTLLKEAKLSQKQKVSLSIEK